MMSAAGTPSTDPWVILARERARYEEQFKSLKPINGVVTGDQAKGFFLQSQLPPMILGQIWALADTDADGKMDINEFSIACKLINLKLRGFEVPKGLPPSLLASLKGSTPPVIPPLPNPSLVSAPPRPVPPKIPPMTSQPLIPNLNSTLLSQSSTVPSMKPTATIMSSTVAPITTMTNAGGIPTGIVPPMQAALPSMQPSMPPMQMGISPMPSNIPPLQTSVAPLQSSIPPLQTNIPPMQTGVPPLQMGVPPLQMGVPPLQTGVPPLQAGIPPLQTGVPPLQASVPPLQSAVPHFQGAAVPLQTGISSVGTGIPPVQPLVTGVAPISTLPKMTAQQPVVTTGFGMPLASGISFASTAPLISSAPLASTASTMTSVAPLGTASGIPPASSAVPLVSSTHMSPASSVSSLGPGATSTPRASVTSMDRAGSLESPQVEWAVPHHVKLKYTQIFNTADRSRTGYLSGAQARNVMVQTKLPQNLLAQIWALSDMDSDGRLGCEEFVLAMHLCEQASLGNSPPVKLPPELVPPSFRRSTRTASISSQGSGPVDPDPASTLLQTTFEDKRKENFEKGQAELDRRRKTLLDQQRKEAEERERKEREEQDRLEKARQEAERKRMEELEKQMRDQQEQERMKEEERKRQADQREAARREMERQRQLEWEKQRLQELQQQRQKEQENVLKLKAKNQSLTIELSSFNEQVKELSQKICDTRVGVSNVKTTIDGMRSTRDTQMQEMSQLKNKLKEQNAKLLHLSQEKVKLEAKNKLNAQMNGQEAEQARLAFENKEITIKNLREKIEDMQKEIEGKLSDIENNNSQLTSLRTELTTLVSQCENMYSVYETKRDKVIEMKNSKKNVDYTSAWKEDAWGDDGKTEPVTDWPVSDWSTTATQSVDSEQSVEQQPVAGVVRYRALYEFVARNTDEISFQPGDIINVPMEQTGEPGWLAGEIRGHTGWFPESYVEPVDGAGVEQITSSATEVISGYNEEMEAKRLEGIDEVPESNYDSVETTTTTAAVQPVPVEETSEICEYYIANFPYQSQEQGDLTFNAGELITVIKKEGDWWTGKIGNIVGIFPSNYVQKVDMNSGANNITSEPPLTSEPPPTFVPPVSIAAAAECANAQIDNEVSQINEDKTIEKPLDPSITANAQVVKSKKPEIASVIAPYQATSSEQLSLARGQLIMIRKKTDTGWWEGELQAKGRKRQVGWFPASYVKVLNSTGRASGRSTPVSTTRMQQEVIIDKVIALYPYTAANPDELSFAKDDIISVTAREEEAWWRGELNGVSGLFPSNYVAPLQQQSKKRYECIKELVTTEKAYVDDMTIVHEVFELPLRRSGILSKKEVDNIFVNWQDILECNRNFCRDLQQLFDSGSQNMGDVLCEHLPQMTAYITFCIKQLDSAALLQSLLESSTQFKDFVKKCQNDYATKGLPLSSFLIKPMQRITRYPLLITKILDNTPDDHEDRPYLEEALRRAERFLNCVNENIRLKENQERLEWLQNNVQNEINISFNSNTKKFGSRKLLHFGLMTKVKSGKELIGFLFNDFFLLVQPSKSIGNQFTFQRNNNISYKMYKQPILVQVLTLSRGSTENVEHGTDSNRVLKLQDDKTKYVVSLLVPSVNECNLWAKRIEAAKEKFLKIDNLQNCRPKTKSPMGPTCGRLLVLVQKGKRFISAGKSHTENIYCEVRLGGQVQQTDIARDNLTNGNVPQNGYPQVPTLLWNYSMQFQLRNINEEVITFTIYELCSFCPDEFLGRAELKVLDIYNESLKTNGPIIKKLILHQVESGEIVVKLDLHLFNNY